MLTICYIFVIDLRGSMKAVKLKLGTHMDNGLMYRVYQNLSSHFS